MKKNCTLLQIFISIWKTMCMRIIPDLQLGILEKYYTSHFLGFLLCNAKKKTLGNARPIEDVSVTEKEIILNIQKGLRYFTEEDSWLHKSIQSIQKT